MSYRQFIHEMGGSGVIYEDDACKYLQKWRTADWIYVDDYIAPIASQILTDASETNRSLYEKLMVVLMEAHEELSKELSFSPTRPSLTRIK